MANEQEIGKLVLRLVAEVGDLKKGLQEAQKTIKDTSDQGKKGADSLSGTIAGIKTSYLAMVAGIYMAYQGLRKVFDLAELGGKVEAIRESFSSLTQSMGVDGDRLVAEIKEYAKVYIDETELMLISNKLLAAGISAADIPKLFESARVGARLMGTTVQDAMELITRAVLTFQTRGLFRQAFPMESEKVFERFADTLKLDVDMLSTFGKQNAMVQEILKMTVERLKLLGGPGGMVVNNYENIQLLNSAWMETKELMATIVVEGIMKTVDAFGWAIDKIKVAYDYIKGTFTSVKETVVSIGAVIGLTSKKPAEIGLAPAHGIISKEDLELAVSHSKATKAQNDKDLVERDKFEKAMTKLRLDAEKARVDAAGQIAMMNLQEQYNRTITTYLKTGQDTFEIDQRFARDKAGMELANTLVSLKAQEAVEVAAAISDKKTREIPAIKAKAREQEKIAQAKYEEEISKLGLDTTKKTIERELALDDAATKIEISHKQALLDSTEDLFNRSLVSASTYYNARNDLMMAIGTDEIKMLQRRLDMESDENKKNELRAQIIEKTNELEKNLTTNKWDGYKAVQAEVQLHTDLLQSYISRQEIMISMARENFEISQGEALKQQIVLQQDLIIRLREQLLLIDQTTDPKRYADQLLAIDQVRAKLQTLNLQLKEQTGTFAEGWMQGIKEWSDGVKTSFQIARDEAKAAFTAIGDSFENLIADSLTGKFKGWKDFYNSLLNDMVRIFAKSCREMAESWISDFLKQITSSSTTGSSGLGGILKGVIGIIGGIFGGGGSTISAPGSFESGFDVGYSAQHGGKITGPSGIDTVPIRATAGEYMQPVHAVRYYGESVMEAIRQQLIPRSFLFPFVRGYAEGGMVTGGGNSMTVNVPVNVNDPRLGSHLRSSIEDVVVRVLKEYSR